MNPAAMIKKAIRFVAALVALHASINSNGESGYTEDMHAQYAVRAADALLAKLAKTVSP